MITKCANLVHFLILLHNQFESSMCLPNLDTGLRSMFFKGLNHRTFSFAIIYLFSESVLQKEMSCSSHITLLIVSFLGFLFHPLLA